MLTGWSGGPRAERLAGRSESEIVNGCLASLSRVLGVGQGSLELDLVAAHFHDWSKDDFSRGAYSYVPVGGAGAASALAEPVKDTLFFAGEATAPDGANVVWIAGLGGVSRVDLGEGPGAKTTVTSLTGKDGLPSGAVFHTLRDRKGRLWIATDRKSTRLNSSH